MADYPGKGRISSCCDGRLPAKLSEQVKKPALKAHVILGLHGILMSEKVEGLFTESWRQSCLHLSRNVSWLFNHLKDDKAAANTSVFKTF